MTTLSPDQNTIPRWSISRVIGRCGMLWLFMSMIGGKVLAQSAQPLLVSIEDYQFYITDLATDSKTPMGVGTPLMLSDDQCLAVLAGEDKRTIEIVDVLQNQVKTITAPFDVLAASISPDNTKIALRDVSYHHIQLIDLATGETTSISHEMDILEGYWTANSRYFIYDVYVDVRSKSYIFDSTTQESHILTSAELYKRYPTDFVGSMMDHWYMLFWEDHDRLEWSANGRYGAGLDYSHTRFTVIDVETRENYRLNSFANIADFVWLPDGEQLFVMGNYAYGQEYVGFIWSFKTGELEETTISSLYDFWLAPDGTKMLVVEDAARSSHVLISIPSGEILERFHVDTWDTYWSPDGRYALTYDTVFDTLTHQQYDFTGHIFEETLRWAADSRWFSYKTSPPNEMYVLERVQTASGKTDISIEYSTDLYLGICDP